MNDAATTASELNRPIGAPPGPRIKPKVFFDDEGMYMVFPDKACSVCAVGLTSRNRYGKATLCTVHGRELDRARKGSRKPAPAVTSGAPSEASGAPRPEQDQALRRLHSLFAHWCKNPTNPDHRSTLKDAMQCHESTAHFKRTFPENDLPSTQQAAIAV